MKLLALDAATEACSAALFDDGRVVERYVVEPRGHARLLLPMAQELLAEAGWRLSRLDALAFGRGPGAFTGLRIAAGVTQGLALGAGLAVVPVSDLAVLALAAGRDHGAARVLAVADARMGEVYWAAYDPIPGAGSAGMAAAEQVGAPERLPAGDFGAGWFGAGNGWAAQAKALAPLAQRLSGVDAAALPHAADVARLAAPAVARGETVAPDAAVPAYVRDEVAWRKA